VVVTPVPVVPSPKAHAHDVTDPPRSVDPDPSNATVRGALPDAGVTDMTAIGGSLALTMPIVAVFEYAESPPALDARTR